MSFLSKRRKLIGDIIIGLLLLLMFWNNTFSFLEYYFQDRLYQRPGMTDPSIVVLGIDEKSLAELGRFQDWSRQIMADAINILNRNEEYRPAVIAIDIQYFDESGDKEADENLAKAAENGGNVITVSQANVGDDQENLSLNAVVRDYETPYPAMARNAAYGFANGILDSDSVIRDAQLKLVYEGEIINSFPYEIYNRLTDSQSNDFLDKNNEMYITYYGNPGEYTDGTSFSDIFDDDFDPEYYADSVVFIGPYTSGLKDSYNTPINREVQMHGVEIHANALQTLLEGNFKKRASQEVNFLILLAAIILATFVSKLKDVRVILGVLITVCAGYVFLAFWLYSGGFLLALTYPVFSLAIIYLYRLIYGYVLETLEKQRVKNAFKKYVDPKLVDKLMETGEANSNEVGVKKEIAVLFVDVRGFTPMSEALKDEPELVVKILNEYLELTSSSVFNNGGSVDKFIGDATMALFNGFVPLEDYAFKAVRAAWDIVKGAAELNASIKAKYNVDVGFGVGVNCGTAIVGNLGPSFRKDYTAIGDTVNTAARLEANAKRSEVLISGYLYEIVKDRVEAESVGEIPLKGKSIKLEIFSVKSIKQDG